MLHTRSIRVSLAGALIASALIGTAAPVHAVAPTTPTNLAAVVNGQDVTLTWTASANNPAQYTLLVGFAPGQTLFSFPFSGTATSLQASAPPGTYYVSLVASNTDGASAASNEVPVVITCAPGTPRNFRVMQRGAEAFLFWLPAGGATEYSIQAGFAPGQNDVQFNLPGVTFNINVPPGTYFARTAARNTCGTSPTTTPDVQVTSPSNTVRVPDPTPGTLLGMPDVWGLINRFASQNPPTIGNSCPTGRKYEPNPWLNGLVDFLRTYDTRFGYNAKPTKTSAENGGFPVIAAGDELAFFAGSGTGEGSPHVHVFDVLGNHCGTTDPVVGYRNIAPEPAIWTSAGRFAGDQQ